LLLWFGCCGDPLRAGLVFVLVPPTRVKGRVAAEGLAEVRGGEMPFDEEEEEET